MTKKTKTQPKASTVVQPQVDQEEIAEPTFETAKPGSTSEVESQVLSIETLNTQLENALADAEKYREGWQRTLADFSNYKKRIDRDQALVYQNASGSILKRYLAVADDMERALKNRPQHGDGAVWAEGIELIYRKFRTIMESEGITPIEAEGKHFDPNLHEAITLEDSNDHESGYVIEIVQQGYMLGDRVLRPALVRVAR
jgi:molecular chaperone GrpE